jgi:hypothetical protein
MSTTPITLTQMEANHIAANMSEIVAVATQLRDLARIASHPSHVGEPIDISEESLWWQFLGVIAGNAANVNEALYGDEGPIQ